MARHSFTVSCATHRTNGRTLFFTLVAIAVSVVQICAGLAIGIWLRKQGAAPATAAEPAMPEPREADAVAGTARQIVRRVSQEVARAEQLGKQPVQSLAAAERTAKQAKELLDNNQALQTELATAQVQLESQAREIESRLDCLWIDALTDLPNQAAFDDKIRRRLAEAAHRQQPLSLVMLDVDDFGELNRQHGEESGDSVLRDIALVLAQQAKGYDLAARLAADAFAIIQLGADLADARDLGRQLRAAVTRRYHWFGDADARPTVSAGIATAEPGEDLATLVSRVEQALQAARDAGGDCAYYHDGVACHLIEESDAAPSASDDRAVAEPPIAAPTGIDRRCAVRRPFNYRQCVAPYRGGELPSKAVFREVSCQDISSTGFSFLSPQLPDFDSLVVALGVSPNLTYMTANIVGRFQLADAPAPLYRIGCRFSGRVG
jgi:diguanylate cyclase (GGDEF)-like protein